MIKRLIDPKLPSQARQSLTTIISDQEGGLVSNLGTKLLDALNIERKLVGPGNVTPKGVVERHIALTKYTMFRLESQARAEGLDVSHGEICQEACMSQNLLLDYNGVTPQMGLTGVG